jgi:hypothetical protein
VWGTTTKFRTRAAARFERGLHELQNALEKMTGEHNAAGRLQSGATAVVAVGIFEEHSASALDQTLSEAAKIIEHRGWEWKAAMNGIEKALQDHLRRTREHIKRPLSHAGIDRSPSAAAAVDQRIAATSARLAFKLAEFRDGWTAPAPKLWKDRQPLAYAVLMLIIGAMVGLAAPVLWERFTPAAGAPTVPPSGRTPNIKPR